MQSDTWVFFFTSSRHELLTFLLLLFTFYGKSNTFFFLNNSFLPVASVASMIKCIKFVVFPCTRESISHPQSSHFLYHTMAPSQGIKNNPDHQLAIQLITVIHRKVLVWKIHAVHRHRNMSKKGITINEAKNYLFSLLTGSKKHPVSSFQNGTMKGKFFK